MDNAIKWLLKSLAPITSNVHHLINRDSDVKYPYITFAVTTTPQDEIRDEHRFELNLFDYGTSRVRLSELDSQIRETLDRKIFKEDEAIYHSRRGLANDIPTGDNTIQRRDIEIVVKQDRRG